MGTQLVVAGCARAALILKSSQCPYGRLLTCCSLFAGRWCLCFEWHSDHLIVHHQWEFSSQCAHSRSKVPIAPLGIPANLPKSTLIFQFGSIFGPIREMYVPAMPANFPSPPWETHVLLVVELQGGGVYITRGTVAISSSTISGNTAGWVRAHVLKFPSP